MTECFSTTQSSFGPAVPTQGQDNYYTIEMPECQDYVFAPTGIARFPYSVKEIYLGMSTMPADATPTAIPYGFTSSVETCNNCGDEPITATMTFPRGGSPYQESVPTATPEVEDFFELPSTLQTEVADGPKTARLENTVLEHKVIEYQGQASGSSNLVKFGIGSDSDFDSDSDSGPKNSGGLSKDIRNYAKMRDTAPSQDVDGAATNRRPPAGVAMALLVPIVLLL
ncbi:hypothetical protein FLONG3_8053 [Fusarium longipes]|uniref:Uncharacterized protein n=1 Tax=Fusarium longipes TaxID=694270 RepID=A0A395S862_9HYPO|nr:hypothetical protein FLONG3_8053 [Fusarium longipes]